MAFDPINYNVDVGDPFKSAVQGYQVGNAIIQQQQAQRQAQQQAAAQQQMSADLNSVANNPNATGTDYARLMTTYPQLSEQLKRGWDVLDSQQRQTRLDQATQVYSALSSGQPEAAKNLFQNLAEAAKNSGNQKEADHAEAMARMIDINPAAVKSQVGMSIISQAGPEKFAEAFGRLGSEQRAQEQAPYALAEQKSKAEQAAYETKVKEVAAKYADSNALLDQQKKGWDITKIAEDIKIAKEQNRIAAMNAAVNRETNDLRRQELRQKIDDAKEKRDEMIRDKVASAESAAGTIDNFLNTSDRILKNPSLNSVLGTIQGRTPALLSDEAGDAIALIDTLGSQAFLSQIPTMKGTGSLTEREGEKLQSSLTNLSRTQSRQQFEYNLKEAQRLMLKARKNLSEKAGIPLGAPDRPNAPKDVSDLNPPKPGAAPTPPAADQKNITVDF